MTFDRKTIHNLAWDADGRSIVFNSFRGNVPSLWRIAAAGLGNSWTVTSAGIYFIAHAERPPYKTKFYDFSTAQTKEIGGVDKLPSRSFAGFSASADGKTILYALFDQNASSIMLAEIGK